MVHNILIKKYMKIYRILPQWLGVKAMAIYPFVLATKTARMGEITINHERIHLAQQRELLVIPFYIWYILEWAIKSIWYRRDAYYDISFEKEAYKNEKDLDYLKNRKPYNYLK